MTQNDQDAYSFRYVVFLTIMLLRKIELCICLHIFESQGSKSTLFLMYPWLTAYSQIGFPAVPSVVDVLVNITFFIHVSTGVPVIPSMFYY